MITEGIVEAYFAGQSQIYLYGVLGTILILGFLALIVSAIFSSRKSQQYRKLLNDLYVSATIRKFADEDGIDLEVEDINFKRWLKKAKITYQDVDLVIEDELKEKISDKNLKKTEKSNKK